VRDNIYLPEGKWFDYWDGTIYEGKTTLNGYSAPLEKLPLLVKAGSIIPMYQQMNYDNERPADTLTLDIYPGPAATFEMFEDEGSNREYRSGKSAKTKLTALCDAAGKQLNEVTIAAAKGDFKGKLTKRTYLLQVHSSVMPKQVIVQGVKLKKCKNAASFATAAGGWYLEPGNKKTGLQIRTGVLPTNADVSIKLTY
jgi:hypothetical protein